ncbi:UPF0249 protein ydjC protein [Fasciola gigantica]|uniref:Carbohydrate deacetylase n=1 Tax=Fasciola gigantica TaxID=46835 RepID=A0A504YEB4_FASGI|nr:UPF0249 protein ydjC protein [Fasciola gigantica]
MCLFQIICYSRILCFTKLQVVLLFVPGLHINLTEGVPVCNPSKVRSLLNEDGLFLGKFGLHSTPFGARKERAINLQHVELELEKQLYAFRALFDAPPSHADGHQHIHVLPGLSFVRCSSLVLRVVIPGVMNTIIVMIDSSGFQM